MFVDYILIDHSGLCPALLLTSFFWPVELQNFTKILNRSYGGEMQTDFLEIVKICRERISVTEGGDGGCWSEYLTTR